MKTFVVYPTNKEELKALKIFMKTMRIPFEVQKSPYSDEFVAKIEEGREQIKRGETRVVYDGGFVDMIKQGDDDIKEGKGIAVDIDKLWE